MSIQSSRLNKDRSHLALRYNIANERSIFTTTLRVGYIDLISSGLQASSRTRVIRTFQGFLKTISSVAFPPGGHIPFLNWTSRVRLVSLSSITVAEAIGFKKSSGARALIWRACQNCSMLKASFAPGGLIGNVWDCMSLTILQMWSCECGGQFYAPARCLCNKEDSINEENREWEYVLHYIAKAPSAFGFHTLMHKNWRAFVQLLMV